MSYNTGNIVSAQPAKDWMDTVGGFIDAHAAWELVEEVAGASTRVTRVYRCLGTQNGFGTDFYIGLCRTSLTSAVGVVLGETWDATAKTFGKGAVFHGGAAVPAADESHATVRHVANETTMVAQTNGFLWATSTNGVVVNTSGFTYYVTVAPNSVVWANSGTGVGIVGSYTGLYDRFHSAALDPFPLVNVVMVNSATGSSTAGGAVTRAIGQGTSSASLPWAAGVTPWSQAEPTVLSNLAGDARETLSDRWWASRVALQAQVIPSSNSFRGGTMHGLLKAHLLFIVPQEVSAAVGDTVTDQASVTWVLLSGTVGVQFDSNHFAIMSQGA
ncbi:MAG: hypothetical protein ACRD0D_01010 [Acidimicrobiales bacterium]